MRRLRFIIKKVARKGMKVTTNENGFRVEFKLKFFKA
jgi:hypothetical protein